jgi:hypothetical protein
MGIDDEPVIETERDQTLIFSNGKNPVQAQLGQKHDRVCRMVFTQVSIENHFFASQGSREFKFSSTVLP